VTANCADNTDEDGFHIFLVILGHTESVQGLRNRRSFGLVRNGPDWNSGRGCSSARALNEGFNTEGTEDTEEHGGRAHGGTSNVQHPTLNVQVSERGEGGRARRNQL
jgi:hypothetical protein